MLAGYYFLNTVKKVFFFFGEVFEGHTGYQYQYQYQNFFCCQVGYNKNLGNKCVNYAQRVGYQLTN